MKGLDGLQGPIYVGTGCVFRRRALYGYDAPANKKVPSKTCNCWPEWCFLCYGCGSRKDKKIDLCFSLNHILEEEAEQYCCTV